MDQPVQCLDTPTVEAWDVQLIEHPDGLFKTVFSVGVQHFTLAESDGEDAREHCAFIRKCFLGAMERAKLVPDTRVAELAEVMAESTRLENENRKLRSLYKHARALLQYVLIDTALVSRLHADEDDCGHAREDLLQGIDETYKRIELLEQDAWTASTQAIKEFLKEAESATFEGHPSTIVGCFYRWVDRFKKLVA